MPAPPPSNRSWESVADRIVFVGGLHRSGTTPLSRWLCSHPAVSGLSGTGKPEDEGQHVQSVYPIAMRHGGPGRFAFSEAAWLTEASPLVTPEAAEQLVADWSPFWDLSRRVLIEKSPPNLVQLRFLRALFPRARFVVIARHPVAVALATGKFSEAGFASLIRHWVTAHARLVSDAARVGEVAVVRYEDLMADPQTVLGALFAFLGLDPHQEAWPVSAELNQRYFARYAELRATPRGRFTVARVRGLSREIERWGYSLTEPALLGPPSPELAGLAPAAISA